MIGYVPAGGTNERWGGGYKEMLPIREGRWMLDNAVITLLEAGCDHVYIGTSPIKATMHMEHIRRRGIEHVSFIMAIPTMWDALKTFLPYALGEDVLMMMADTITVFDSHSMLQDWSNINLGVFATIFPEQFSVFLNDRIVTKPQDIVITKSVNAWGIVGWSDEATRLWLNAKPDGYDEAFNLAIKELSSSRFYLPYYYDFADFKSYSRYIGEQDGSR